MQVIVVVVMNVVLVVLGRATVLALIFVLEDALVAAQAVQVVAQVAVLKAAKQLVEVMYVLLDV